MIAPLPAPFGTPCSRSFVPRVTPKKEDLVDPHEVRSSTYSEQSCDEDNFASSLMVYSGDHSCATRCSVLQRPSRPGPVFPFLLSFPNVYLAGSDPSHDQLVQVTSMCPVDSSQPSAVCLFSNLCVFPFFPVSLDPGGLLCRWVPPSRDRSFLEMFFYHRQFFRCSPPGLVNPQRLPRFAL